MVIFYFCSFARVVCHVHTLLSGRNFQPLWKVKGLEQYHGRYVFQTVFLRSMNTDMRIHTCTNTYIYICMCVLCFFLLCGAVSCRVPRVVGCWLSSWVWCRVVLSTCRGGLCPWSFLLRMMSMLQRARAECSMVERRVGQYMECVVFAPSQNR